MTKGTAVERWLRALREWRRSGLWLDPGRRPRDVGACVRAAMAVQGHVPEEDVRALVGLARGVPAGAAIVEIGSYRGRSAVALALGAQLSARNRVYAIDPHTEFVGPLGGHYGPVDQAALYNNLTRAGLGDQVAVVCLPSLAAARGWPARDVGLLWIDGDHTAAAVRADYEAWQPWVLPGGVVAFHDSDVPGVRGLLDALAAREPGVVLGRAGSVTWLRGAPPLDAA